MYGRCRVPIDCFNPREAYLFIVDRLNSKLFGTISMRIKGSIDESHFQPEPHFLGSIVFCFDPSFWRTALVFFLCVKNPH